MSETVAATYDEVKWLLDTVCDQMIARGVDREMVARACLAASLSALWPLVRDPALQAAFLRETAAGIDLQFSAAGSA
jgi:hypothetical protein